MACDFMYSISASGRASSVCRTHLTVGDIFERPRASLSIHVNRRLNLLCHGSQMNPSIKSQWLQIALSLAVAVIIPVAATPIMTPFQQIMLGIGTYIVILLTRIGLQMGVLQAVSSSQRKALMARGTATDRLYEIEHSYGNILTFREYEANYPAQFYYRRLSGFADDIYHSAAKQEIRSIDEPYEWTELLCKVVGQTPKSTLRLMFDLDNLQFLADSWNRGYYELQVRLAIDHGARVRRLFITRDHSQLLDPFAKRVLEFHTRAPGFECRTISAMSWGKLVNDLRIPDSTQDFGVWGDDIVYKSTAANFQRIEGIFCFQPRLVATYTKLFDLGWRQGTAPNPPHNTKPMTLWELFNGTKPPADVSKAEEALWTAAEHA